MPICDDLFNYMLCHNAESNNEVMYTCVCSVGYILNVTREIDNFFPGIFEYCNIRIYDLEDSDLLKHWPRTFDFITKARSVVSFCLCNCTSL